MMTSINATKQISQIRVIQSSVCLVTKAMMNIFPCTLPKIWCQACDSTKNHLIGGHGTLLFQGYI
jgi:hypothetical protein